MTGPKRTSRHAKRKASLKFLSLFAGIGGFEKGLVDAGHVLIGQSEICPAAISVLKAHFHVKHPITDITDCDYFLPDTDLVTAGFPCQDLSQAGKTAGIKGKRSGLVERVFELLEKSRKKPRWLLFENVPFMLTLNGGNAMEYLTDRLVALHYNWAYRVIDARSFGLPQRRKRVYLLAKSASEGCDDAEPWDVLLSHDVGEPTDYADPRRDQVPPTQPQCPCGFYWTEGNRGWGWAYDAVPTLKAGSGLRIPSPPAIILPDGRFVTLPIDIAEQLMGFDKDWTQPALGCDGSREGDRWRLVGNAVSVPVVRWIGEQLAHSYPSYNFDTTSQQAIQPGRGWPSAGWGRNQEKFRAKVSDWPERKDWQSLQEFLKTTQVAPALSPKAAKGFYKRITAQPAKLRIPDWFTTNLKEYVRQGNKTID